jgi:hypothetical protein
MNRLLLPLFCFSFLFSNAQETICFGDVTKETNVARYVVTNAVCQDDVIKAKVRVTNLTDNAIVIKPEECFFTTPKGNSFDKGRWFIVGAHEEKAEVIAAKGDGIKCKEATLNINGVYSCIDTTTTTVQPMKLEPQKEIRVGNFLLELDGYDKDKTEIAFKYKVTYVGNKVGTVRPGKASLKSASGKEFKNFKEVQKVLNFKKGDDFLVGFLFYVENKKEDETLYFNDMLTESDPVKTTSATVDLKIDETLTKEKNK